VNGLAVGGTRAEAHGDAADGGGDVVAEGVGSGKEAGRAG